MGFLVLASALLLVVVVMTGCSPVKRHALASFLIDGVPPYVSPEERARLLEEERARSGPGQLVSGRRGSGFGQEPMRFFHGPYAAKECSRCHKMDMAPGGSKGGKGGSSAGMSWRSSMVSKDILRKPIDELCLSCHDDFSRENTDNEGLWIHGPVSAGWCATCHDPHASPYQNLLLDASMANVCSGCHRVEDLLAFTPEHRKEGIPRGEDEEGDPELEMKEAPVVEKIDSLVEDCTRCHDPHRGRDQLMLRADYQTRELKPDAQEQAVVLDEL